MWGNMIVCLFFELKWFGYVVEKVIFLEIIVNRKKIIIKKFKWIMN